MGKGRLAGSFGRLIRRLRTEAGHSQEVFAELCELHRTYIGAIERGEKSVSIDTADKLAIALGLHLWRLFQQMEQDRTTDLYSNADV